MDAKTKGIIIGTFVVINAVILRFITGDTYASYSDLLNALLLPFTVSYILGFVSGKLTND